MPRLRQVPRNEAAPEVLATYDRLFGERDPVAQPGTATGTPGNWWTVFALSPDVFGHALAGFGLMTSKSRKLPPYLRELALLRTGFASGSQFVFSQHAKTGRAAGVPDAKIEAIPSWSSSDVFDATDRAVLAYTDALVLEDGRVQDGTFNELKKHLDDEAILELSYAIGTYRMHAIITRALRLEFDDVDERVVEVPSAATR